MSEISMRLAVPEDTEAILALVRDALGEGSAPKNRSYWTWKHIQNPFGVSPCMIAEAQGDIVGVRAFMRWCWSNAAGTQWAVRAVDTATHEAWRGKGIFSRLTLALAQRLTTEGVSFVFNTPNRSSLPGYVKMGWHEIGKVTVRGRPMQLSSVPALLAGRSGSASPWAGSSALFRPASEVCSVPSLDAFLENTVAPSDMRLTTVRTREYLQWRYGDIPGFDYRAVWNISGSDGALYIFRIKQHRRFRELRIVESLIGSGRQSARAATDILGQVLAEPVAEIITASCSKGTPERSTLNRNFFIPLPNSGPLVTARPLAGSAPNRLGELRASLGDLELF